MVEFCIGGGIVCLFIDELGVLSWFECGFVIYFNLFKEEMLGVLCFVLEIYGVVSEEVVLVMVRGVLVYFNGDVSILVSGVVGLDGGIVEKLVGMVWIGWGFGEGVVEVQCFLFFGDCDEVCNCSMLVVMEGLIEWF